QCRYRRIEGLGGGDGRHGLDRHVLHVEGHHIHDRGELAQGSRVVEPAADELAGLGARRIAAGVQEGEEQAQWIAGQGQHASELAGPDDADVHAGMEGFGCARTLAVCCARQSTICRRVAGRFTTRRETSSFAVWAPRPISGSVVTTVTPAGTCTIYSWFAMLRSMRAWTCMPSTCRVVLAAVMPVRWAAPPP